MTAKKMPQKAKRLVEVIGIIARVKYLTQTGCNISNKGHVAGFDG
jgi:hypothetical protein